MASRARVLALRLARDKWCVSRVFSRAFRPLTRPNPTAASFPTHARRASPSRGRSRAALASPARRDRRDSTRFASLTLPPTRRRPTRRTPSRAARRGFHASAVPEPCRARAAAVAADLERNKAAGPERFLPAFAADAAARAAASFARRFHAWGESPEGSWRRRAHTLGSLALDRIHPDDQVLLALPPACSSVELLYPETAHPEEARRAFREFLTERARAVASRFRRNAFVYVPLTFPLMFTPLSNLPMYWFGWRAFEQRRAARNADAARRAMELAECADAQSADGALWAAADAPCARARAPREGGGGGETHDAPDERMVSMNSENPSHSENRTAFSCCRVAHDPAYPPPALVFAPCALLDESADAPREGEKSALEKATGIDELTNLTRRYRRALKARPE